MADLREVPYVNQFGQQINIGDPVVYAGTSMHQTSFDVGKYGGLYFGEVSKHVHILDDNGEPLKDGRGYFQWRYEKTVEAVAVKVYDIPCTKYNYKTKEHVPGKRCAYLPKMNIFRLDTPIETLVEARF